MNNQTLVEFIGSQIFDEDYGNLIVDLPLNVSNHIENEARKFANIERMVSTDDILENWGTVENFHKWKSSIVHTAELVNFNYLVGYVDSLVSVYRKNEQKNGVRANALSKINVQDFVKNTLNDHFNTDSE